MPTFQSIRIHPQLRLVSGDHVIETPQALLSRHPAQLQLRPSADDGTLQALAWPEIQKLRHEVAQALVEQSVTGQRVRDICERIQRTDDKDDNAASIRFPGTVSLQQLLQYETAIKPSNPLKSGCPTLDTWLERGLVVQIAGPSASGKTQLVLQLLAQNGGQYWSSDPALRSLAKRFHELGSTAPVSFLYIRNEYDLLRHLNGITSDTAPEILVMDSFSTCLTNVEYSDTHMRQQITGALRSVTQHYQITVFLVNGTVGAAQPSVHNNNEQDDDEEEEDDDDDDAAPRSVTIISSSSSYKPAFSWWKVDDIRIWMEAAANRRTVHIRLDRHPTRGQNDICTVRIDSAGVTEWSAAPHDRAIM
jgi:hypothetical protein